MYFGIIYEVCEGMKSAVPKFKKNKNKNKQKTHKKTYMNRYKKANQM